MIKEKGNNLFSFLNRKINRVHFVGIGGAGMSVLARIILALGFEVSGSDLKENEITMRLSKLGADIFQGHQEGLVDRADLVVYSSAVDRNNPELIAARRLNVKIIHRSELLAELMKRKKGIAVAGSHGKTSTAAMIAWILLKNEFSPAVAIGGEIIDLEENSGWGEGDYLVAEADESDGSLARLYPDVAVITGLDLDHVDYYTDWKRMIEIFKRFVSSLTKNGRLIVESGTPDLNRISMGIPEVVTYGLSSSARIRADRINFYPGKSKFAVYDGDKELGEITLSRPGLCNITNSLGAIACCLKEGVPFCDIANALNSFRGVKRRLEIKAESPFLIVEDYAHHPVEVAAALAALRFSVKGRLWCIFQPHRYSRTRYFFRELAESLLAADKIILTELYPAFEDPIPGVTSALILNALWEMNRPDALLLDQSSIRLLLEKEVTESDAVIIMGAGDIGILAGMLAKENLI